MKNSPMVWLMLGLVLTFYSLYVFISNGSGSVWSLVTGVMCALGACTAFWRSSRERTADRG